MVTGLSFVCIHLEHSEPSPFVGCSSPLRLLFFVLHPHGTGLSQRRLTVFMLRASRPFPLTPTDKNYPLTFSVQHDTLYSLNPRKLEVSS